MSGLGETRAAAAGRGQWQRSDDSSAFLHGPARPSPVLPLEYSGILAGRRRYFEGFEVHAARKQYCSILFNGPAALPSFLRFFSSVIRTEASLKILDVLIGLEAGLAGFSRLDGLTLPQQRRTVLYSIVFDVRRIQLCT